METNFQTVREAARKGIAPERMLRRMIHEGRCPGVQNGNRFLINMRMLQEQLDEESKPTNSP